MTRLRIFRPMSKSTNGIHYYLYLLLKIYFSYQISIYSYNWHWAKFFNVKLLASFLELHIWQSKILTPLIYLQVPIYFVTFNLAECYNSVCLWATGVAEGGISPNKSFKELGKYCEVVRDNLYVDVYNVEMTSFLC